MNAALYQEIDKRFAEKDYAGAMRTAEWGLAHNPVDPNLYRAIARVHHVNRNSPAAQRWFTALINHDEPRYQNHIDRALVRNEMYDYPGVISDLNIAELMKTDDPMLYLRRGGAHWEMRDWASAARDIRRALELAPHHADIVWVHGLLSLQTGNFVAGWPGYEARWRSQRFKSNRLVTEKPQWSPNSGLKRVLVWGEQGIGDQIFYASALNHLRYLTDKVTMLVDPRMISLLQRSLPTVDFLPNTAEVSVDEHDSHLPIASLLAQFINTIDDIPQYTARNYLRADPNKVTAVRARLPQGKPIIGISWTSAAIKIGPHKSIALEQLEPLLSDRFTFVNLQYVQSTTEQVHKSIHRAPVNCRDDFEGLAALLTACDLVISVSSSTVHVAGALGRPVLLMDANKLWYWGNRDDNNMSYWYPSVQVFPRDHVMAPWNKVINNVRAELERRYPDGH